MKNASPLKPRKEYYCPDQFLQRMQDSVENWKFKRDKSFGDKSRDKS